MTKDNPLFPDMTRLAQDAAGALAGVRGEVEGLVQSQVTRLLDRMNLVRREEVEALQLMIAKMQAQQEALSQRLAQVEKQNTPTETRDDASVA